MQFNYNSVLSNAAPTVLADSSWERTFWTDADSVSYDASLDGIHLWDFWMDNTGPPGTIVQSPAVSLLSQYARDMFGYVEPEPVVSQVGSDYRYDWTGLADIPTDGSGGEAYIESNIPVTFSPGIDSERIVTPPQISAADQIQTVTIRLTPQEAFQRIMVRITSSETGLTSGTYVTDSASPAPDDTSLPNSVAWNYQGSYFQVGTTYEFTAQFLIHNKAYPNAVINKPRVRVHGQYILENSQNQAQGNSLTKTDSILGDVTYSAIGGPYIWDYFARERRVVVYNQLNEIAGTVGQPTIRYIGERGEPLGDLTLQPQESITFTPPIQEGWSFTRSNIALNNVSSPIGLAHSLDEVYSLIQIQGGHVWLFDFSAESNNVRFYNDAGTTSITIKNISPGVVSLQGVGRRYDYVSATGIQPTPITDLGGNLRQFEFTVPAGFVALYKDFFNRLLYVSIDWSDVGRAIPIAIFSPDLSTGQAGPVDIWQSFRNDHQANYLFDSYDTGMSLYFSQKIGWWYYGNDGNRVTEQLTGLIDHGVTVEGTWRVQLQVLDPNHISNFDIPGTSIGGSLRLEKRVLLNSGITLHPGQPYTFSAPNIPGWYRDESDYLYIIPDPLNPTSVPTNKVLVTSPALHAPQYWYEYSSDWHPFGGTVTIELDPTVTEPVTFLYTYIVGYYTNFPTAGIQVDDVQTNEGNYIRHDLSITLPDYSIYAALGFDDPPTSGDLSLWTPGLNWLLGDLITPQDKSAEDHSIRNPTYHYLPDMPSAVGEGITLQSVYQQRFGLSSNAWMNRVYNVMQASGYSAAGTWHWTAREPIIKTSKDATIIYEGLHNDHYESITLAPDGTWSYTVPAPPEGWVLNGYASYIELGSVDFDQGSLLSDHTLLVAGAHLTNFYFDQNGNYIDWMLDAGSTTVTIQNTSPNTVTFGYIDAMSRYSDVKDISTADVIDIGPDYRTIYVNVPYGFVSQYVEFFNTWLAFRLRWNGKAVPWHVYSPGPVSRYMDVLQTYRTEPRAVNKLGFRFADSTVRIQLARPMYGNGFYERGIQVEGKWRFDLQVLDPNQPARLSPELGTYLTNEKVIREKFELAAAGSPGDSLTITPPNINGWYRQYADYLGAVSNTDGVDSTALTVTTGARWGVADLPYSNWVTWGDSLTVRNTANQPVSYTIEYNVFYFTPLQFTDTQTVTDSTIQHDLAFTMPTTIEMTNLGFEAQPPETMITVNTPLTNPPWEFSTFTLPNGQSADDSAFNNPNVEFMMGYYEGETLNTSYGGRNAGADFIYSVLGDNAAGEWKITAYEPATLLRFTLGSPANLLVTDPIGRQVGFDGANVVNEVPGATYSGQDTEPQMITIPNPITGVYGLQLIGTGSGTYTLTTETTVGGVAVSQQVTTGTITNGEVILNSMPLENPEGTPTTEPITPGPPPPPDNTPPTTTIQVSGTQGNNGWYVSDVQLSLTAIDNPGGSGVMITQYGFDGSSWVTYSTPIIVSDGTTTLYYRSIDVAGNIETAKEQTVMVDTNLPTLTLPSLVPVEATGPNGAIVTFTVTATDNLDGTVTPSCSPTSGSVFALGETTVSCSATDNAGNKATGTFKVTVVDTTAPKLTLPLDMTVQAPSPSGVVVTFSASASDFVDGSVPVTCTPASGSTFPVGTTTVACQATDNAANKATGSFKVTVQYTPTKYQLTVSVSPSGTGTTNPAGSYLYTAGSVVSVKATAASGFAFSSWLLDSSPAGSANPISVTMNGPHTLQALFINPSCPAANRNLKGANLKGANFAYCNLAGRDLSGSNLQNVNFLGANLQGAKLQGSNLAGANLQNTNLQNANLQGASLAGDNFQGANLAGANLQGANLAGANFQGDNLQGAILQGANLQNVNFSGAILQGANLLGSNLSHANLHNANLRNANLQGANLSGADLTGADLTGANTAGANFSGANTKGCTGNPVCHP